MFIALCVGACVGIRAYTKPTPPVPFTLTGTVHLNTNSVTTSGLPSGFGCAGTQAYNDIGPSAPVTVADESGKLLAKGAIESSYGQQGSCTLLFKVDKVPGGAKFYKVQVARQSEVSYTEAEARAGIDFLVGTFEPSSTPTPTTSTTAPTATTTPLPTVDPQTAALNQLRATAEADRPTVPCNTFSGNVMPKLTEPSSVSSMLAAARR